MITITHFSPDQQTYYSTSSLTYQSTFPSPDLPLPPSSLFFSIYPLDTSYQIQVATNLTSTSKFINPPFHSYYIIIQNIPSDSITLLTSPDSNSSVLLLNDTSSLDTDSADLFLYKNHFQIILPN